ncbi:AAA family ATPase [Albibacterium indicum]|uniref:AAA family ATPase n=1 Tax=Albibacterium indicum TaxID=2292082 RepID=UPI000E4FB870|nr:AAA family ATPase [Pedobacter indicus]
MKERIAGIYIKEGQLPEIFGEDHASQIINLGGANLYSDVHGRIEAVENPQYIPGFWGKTEISNISVLVGENGVGKTTILNVFRSAYTRDGLPGENPISFIIERDTTVGVTYEVCDPRKFYTVYYTGHYESFSMEGNNDYYKDISISETMYEDIKFTTGNMAQLMLLADSYRIKRWIKFRAQPGVSKMLGKTALPVFERIKIKVHNDEKRFHDTSYNFRPFFEDILSSIKTEIGKTHERKFEELRDQEKLRDQKYDDEEYRIKLKYRIIESVVRKIILILEGTGNKYLEEGKIRNDWDIESVQYQKNESVKDKINWFLKNAYILYEKNKIYFPRREIMDFMSTLISCIPHSNKTKNWTEFYVNFEQAKEVIDAYDVFILAFKDHFVYDKDTPITFSVDRNLSSGEKNIYNLFSNFSNWYSDVLNGVDVDENRASIKTREFKNYIFLIDEGDVGFHPEWKKRFVNILIEFFSFLLSNKNVQLILTTHDPLTLSDIPKNNVSYLERIGDRTVIRPDLDQNSFGANITDLLKDAFFVKDGLIGDFAKSKINNIIQRLNTLTSSDLSDAERQTLSKEILLIGEPIIFNKLWSMYTERFEVPDSMRREYLKKQIEELQKDLNKLDRK